MKPLRTLLIVVLALGVALLGTGLIVHLINTPPKYVNTWVQAEDAQNSAFPARIEFFTRDSCDVDGESRAYQFKGNTVQIADTQYDVAYDLNNMMLSNASGSASYVSIGSTEQFEYKIENGGAVITDYHGEQNILVIPSTLGGAPVTMVDSGLDHKNFTKVVIPEGVDTIGERTFKGCYHLKEVVLPSTIREIGYYAFAFCTSLESIHIPEGVTSISWNTFNDCEKLSSISLPASLTELDPYAYGYCPPLREVILAPENATYMVKENAILSADGTTLVSYFSGSDNTSYTVPAGVITIGSYAFSNCLNLREVVVSEGVTKIEDGAFFYCDQLANISIPASVTDCADPFYYCNAITEVTIARDNPNYQVNNGLLLSKDGTALVSYLYGATGKTLVLPEGITSLAPYPFPSPNHIDRIVLPQSIGRAEACFSECMDNLLYLDVTIVAPKDSAVYAYAKEIGLKVKASGK